MPGLMLSRKAGESVRLMVDGKAEYLDILNVTGGSCKMRIYSSLQVETVRFKDEMQIAEGVTVTVFDLAKGYAKLNFIAPRDVAILRTELIKEKESD